jgi:hypothetical protein
LTETGERIANQTSKIEQQPSFGGEDRNRTYPDPAYAGSTTVLKTARATRHPSLSGWFSSNGTAVGEGVAFPVWEADSFPYRRIEDYLSFLIAPTIWSKSGQSPESSLEWRSLSLARISKAPPPDGMSVSDLMRSPSSRILTAKLTAFGV